MKITPNKNDAGTIVNWTVELDTEELCTVATGLAIAESVHGVYFGFQDPNMGEILHGIGDQLESLHKEYDHIFSNTLTEATAKASLAGVN